MQYGYQNSKEAEFHVDFESGKKVLKKCTQKSYQQKRDGNTDSKLA